MAAAVGCVSGRGRVDAHEGVVGGAARGGLEGWRAQQVLVERVVLGQVGVGGAGSRGLVSWRVGRRCDRGEVAVMLLLLLLMLLLVFESGRGVAAQRGQVDAVDIGREPLARRVAHVVVVVVVAVAGGCGEVLDGRRRLAEVDHRRRQAHRRVNARVKGRAGRGREQHRLVAVVDRVAFAAAVAATARLACERAGRRGRRL